MEIFQKVLKIILKIICIITFYRCFEDYEKNMNIFSDRLYEAYDNFERHKNEILPFKNLKKNTEKYIKIIFMLISQDKQDVMGLITEIEDTISQAEETKKNNIGNIVTTILCLIYSLVGAIFIGGGNIILFIIGMILSEASIGIIS